MKSLRFSGENNIVDALELFRRNGAGSVIVTAGKEKIDEMKIKPGCNQRRKRSDPFNQ